MKAYPPRNPQKRVKIVIGRVLNLRTLKMRRSQLTLGKTFNQNFLTMIYLALSSMRSMRKIPIRRHVITALILPKKWL